jgi:hypothetical protein
VYYLGFLDELRSARGRRDSEQRIQRRTKSSIIRQTRNTDPDDELEAAITRYQKQAYRVGSKLWDTTQNRKAEGKQILISTIKHSIGATARTILGPRKTTLKKSKPKMANPTIKLKTKRKKINV